MPFLLSLTALAATAPDLPLLELAQPGAVAEAVQSCGRAIAGKVRVDRAALEAEGWRPAGGTAERVVLRKPGNDAIIIFSGVQSTSFPYNLFQQHCFVRARLSDAPALKAVAAEVSAVTRTDPYVFKRKADHWSWQGASTWISMEPFDPAPDGTPITQLAVIPAPLGWRRPPQDASSQNKNQEPR